MIPFHWYVLCIGILLCWHANDVMFWGYKAHFGTQKNYATGTMPLLPMLEKEACAQFYWDNNIWRNAARDRVLLNDFNNTAVN